ncbi:hypothetical protein PsYK624_156760 [Phanerochaete sordida]|uniref:Uncharacterized protein n=1 Tax=Phanerochaete sordida TaxID=48140 RepID=A0A9P3LM70_9APHY|nr:hypothetical protein PsYK624_156760 [Phanerochaete sordida]
MLSTRRRWLATVRPSRLHEALRTGAGGLLVAGREQCKARLIVNVVRGFYSRQEGTGASFGAAPHGAFTNDLEAFTYHLVLKARQAENWNLEPRRRE